MAEGVYKVKGFAQYDNLAAVVALADTPTVGVAAPDGAYRCVLQARAQNIRWRDDGNNPSSTVGHILYAGDPPWPYEGDIDKLRLIEEAGGAQLMVSYYGI